MWAAQGRAAHFREENMARKPKTAEIGDNSNGQLKSFVERIESLLEEKQILAEDVKSVYVEAQDNGFDTKIIRKVIAIRKQDADKRAEEEALLDLYLTALGMA
jgi:uncharacterized protein (UPF0335 family)